MFRELLYFFKYKKINFLCHISFKIFIPLAQLYTLLSATVKVFETLLEAIFWKPFQLLRRILNDVSSTPFNVNFSRGNR